MKMIGVAILGFLIAAWAVGKADGGPPQGTATVVHPMCRSEATEKAFRAVVAGGVFEDHDPEWRTVSVSPRWYAQKAAGKEALVEYVRYCLTDQRYLPKFVDAYSGKVVADVGWGGGVRLHQ